MTVINNEKVIMFDVDDTLVMWGEPSHQDAVCVWDPGDDSNNYVVPHKFHIDLLKKHKGRGYTVVVWSQGGFSWASSVVNTLQIQDYVDFVMTKPLKHVDDLPCKEWMGQHLYFDQKGHVSE